MSLPPELLSSISWYLTPGDLSRLSLSNSTFSSIARPFLYCDIIIARHSLNLAITLYKKPQLAFHVRSLKVVVGPTCQVLGGYYRALYVAISRMPMLEILSIAVPHLRDSSMVLPGGQGLVYERLRQMVGSFPLDYNLVSFLKGTPRLSGLILDAGATPRKPVTIPCTHTTLLRDFCGTVDDACAVVPGRPITSILLRASDLTIDAARILATSTSQISTLDAEISYPPLQVLQVLADVMPHLENLRLTTDPDFCAQWFVPEFVQETRDILQRFPCLVSASISGLVWRWSTSRTGERVLYSEPYLCPVPSPHIIIAGLGTDTQWAYGNHL